MGRHESHSVEKLSVEDLDELVARVDGHLGSHYFSAHATIKGVTLAAAGASAATLIHNHSATSYSALFWFLWSTSVLSTVISYSGMAGGIVTLRSTIPSLVDVTVPMVLGILEFFLFGVLTPSLTHMRGRSVVAAWFVGFSIWSMCAAIHVARAWSLTDVEQFKDGLKTDAALAMGVGLVVGPVGLWTTTFSRQPSPWVYVPGSFAAATLIVGLGVHEKRHRRLQALIAQRRST
jgi:hypothetical protein